MTESQPAFSLSYTPHHITRDTYTIEGFLDDGVVEVEISGVDMEDEELESYDINRTLEVGQNQVEEDTERLIEGIDWDAESMPSRGFGGDNISIEVHYDGEDYDSFEEVGGGLLGGTRPNVEVANDIINKYVEQV